MLGREAEERGEARALGLEPVGGAARTLAHRLAHPVVEVFDELVEDRELRVEVQVVGALADARDLGDARDGCLVVAV